jgi:hypothetical protein
MDIGNQPKPEKTPAASEAAEKQSRLARLRAALTTPTEPTLWGALRQDEREFLQHWWKISQAELMADPFDQSVVDNLRPAATWDEGTPQGFLLAVATISTPIVADSLIEIRTIDKGAQIAVGIDCTAEERDKWLAAGLVKTLPCMTVRALVTSSLGVSVPRLTRGKLLCIRGESDERILMQWLEIGYVEHICEGAYRGKLSELRPCPLPRKAKVTQEIEKITRPGEPMQRRAIQRFSSEFADPPRIGGPRFQYGVSYEQRPVVKVRSRFTGVIDGLHVTRGTTFEVGSRWAMAVVADPALKLQLDEPRLGMYTIQGIDCDVLLRGNEDWLPDAKPGDAPLEVLDPIPAEAA